ncbi:MAG: hypothetical protein N3B10_08640 [Armatimonadetes bacterium]|nr:hypothetical protein [Armatimonadota bacterium]MCX7968541.1 hypothetical protein [Armatimonadota bacterium]MDW8142172.1 hypothetical protein [Armatimonadota bacterium]
MTTIKSIPSGKKGRKLRLRREQHRIEKHAVFRMIKANDIAFIYRSQEASIRGKVNYIAALMEISGTGEACPNSSGEFHPLPQMLPASNFSTVVKDGGCCF